MCINTRTYRSILVTRTYTGGGGFRPSPSNVFIWQRIHKCDIPFCSSRRALSKRIKKFTFPVTWLGDNREKPYKNGIFLNIAFTQSQNHSKSFTKHCLYSKQLPTQYCTRKKPKRLKLVTWHVERHTNFKMAGAKQACWHNFWMERHSDAIL